MQSTAQMLYLAIQHHQAGRLHQAELLYRQILQVDPQHADALHLLGLLAHQVGRNDLAVTYIQQSLNLRPGFFAVHNNLALALRAQGKLDEAIVNYREALRLKPDFIEALSNLGNALKDRGNLEEAAASFRQALRLRPDLAEIYTNLGIVLKAQGHVDEAVANYREALRRRPDDALAHNNLGIVLQEQGQLDEAISYYRESLRLKHGFVEARNNLGVALMDHGKLDEAVISLKEVLSRKPDYAEAHNNLGNVLRKQKKRQDALCAYREALRLNPDYVEAYNNQAIVLNEEGRLDEAVASTREAIIRKPDFADAYINLGIALHDLGRLEESIASYRQALQFEPENGDAYFKMALPLLQQGNFTAGWQAYEWRWRASFFQVRRGFLISLGRLQWDGSPLQGRSIRLHVEQGLGDMIQFVRYASLLKQQGAGRVVLVCPLDLQRLMATCADVDEVICSPPFPDCDVGAFLVSLPRLLGTTSVERIPAQVPYLGCDPELVERWQTRLAALDDRPAGWRVGIVWQGNPDHVADRWRSVSLDRFAALADLPGVRLISLQKGDGRDQLVQMPELALDLGPELNDMADTAAVIRCLDLVITVDTAVAHLAGALGAPVWLALSTISDWRWLLQREDSPWYPSMRLFRQSQRGQWDEVFRRIKIALSATVPYQ